MAMGSRSSIKMKGLTKGEADDVAGDYEREAVPESALQSDWSFATVFAGRHTAAPELILGPEFVKAGATSVDMFVGLILGNILAVLAWRYICAPIAVAKRFSTYYTVERIFGKVPLAIYSVVVALVLAVIAGVMFLIAATAVCVQTGWSLPEGDDRFVSDWRVLIVVVAIGLITTAFAMFGFKLVTLVSYWMTPPMFVVIFYMIFRALGELNVTFGNIFEVASEKVFTGVVDDGVPKRNFIAVVLLAFFQDQFVHLGMVDLTLFRFAETAKSGWMSAFGMFPGHYFLWIGACFLYAAEIQVDPAAKNGIPVGPVAYRLGGWPGLIAIVFAAWSTAIPFLYAGGLALKSTFSIFGCNPSTTVTTAVLGLVAIVPALMPTVVFSFAGTLNLFGNILVPVGAVILADFHILPTMGRQSEYSYEKSEDCNTVNFPALIAWGLSTIFTLVFTLNNVVSFWFTPLLNFPMALGIYVVAVYYMHPTVDQDANRDANVQLTS